MNIELFIVNVCKHNDLDVDKLKSYHKAEPYNSIRRAIIFFLRDKNKMKLSSIGIEMGRTKQAISKAIKIHENYYRFNSDYKKLYDTMCLVTQ